MELFLILEGHRFLNDVQTMSQVFFPNTKYTELLMPAPDGITIKSIVESGVSTAIVFKRGIEQCRAAVESAGKNDIKKSIYYALSNYTGIVPKWGILTGIRPAKLAGELLKEKGCAHKVKEILKKDYLLNESKASLCLTVHENERELLKNGAPCVYIGIPFCPSKCLYCSFTSYPIEKYAQSADTYLKCLIQEIFYMPDIKPAAIYIGGGTPTSLNENMLNKLLLAISDKFDISGVEFTVEAGRPDTITKDKLKLMKKGGVTRLSINPQTMSERTLQLIGRNHAPKDIVNAFNAARDYGFNNINMDLIIGLPHETPEIFNSTMEQITLLSPESITVHTLAVKRASKLKESLVSYSLSDAAAIEKMLDISQAYARQMNMIPYYMYRQKNMLGNFENVGYCKKGFHCIYNIIIMEETHTIYAAGAGAVTKFVDGSKISRTFNAKDVSEYIRRKS